MLVLSIILHIVFAVSLLPRQVCLFLLFFSTISVSLPPTLPFLKAPSRSPSSNNLYQQPFTFKSRVSWYFVAGCARRLMAWGSDPCVGHCGTLNPTHLSEMIGWYSLTYACVGRWRASVQSRGWSKDRAKFPGIYLGGSAKT